MRLTHLWNKNKKYGYKINAFTLSKNLVSSIGKKQPSPTRKPNGLAAPHKKSNLESIPLHLLDQVLQHNFKDGLIL